MNQTHPFYVPRLIHVLSLSAAVVCGSATAQEAQQADQPSVGETINDTRAMLDRWLELRRTISKETNDWALSKDILQARIEMLRSSIEQTRQELDKQKTELAGFDSRVAELEASNEKLKQSADELAVIVQKMEERTVAILQGAPQPLLEEVRPLAVQLRGYSTPGTVAQADGATPAETTAQDAGDSLQESSASLSRRFENVVGVLYLFNKYTGKIDQKKQLIVQPDGTTLSVDVIYLGTSYGFYVDEGDKAAAAGWPGSGGWGWSPIKDSALQVREAVKVFNKDTTAAFINLPVEVK